MPLPTLYGQPITIRSTFQSLAVVPKGSSISNFVASNLDPVTTAVFPARDMFQNENLEVLPFDQEKHLFDMYKRKSIHLNGKIFGFEGRIGEMLDSVPGNLDVTETMVQAVQLHHQSLCR